ncbi:MAG: Gfo/Idh/MocA family oxidoreductase [Cyclobacteriaceae bacterium]
MSGNTNKGRRSILKALGGIPVLGLFSFGVNEKINYVEKSDTRKAIIKELGLDDLDLSIKPIKISKGDLIRVGIIGYGIRGRHLSKALGYLSKERFEKEPISGAMESQIRMGNPNVALVGICDVFDNHAENGMADGKHDFYTGGKFARKHPVKRYLSYQDMLSDPNIDAVMIATPDHHHVRITIDAVNAGKHVYCEKAPIHREEELEPLYQAVKNSGVVYQLGHQIPQNAIFQQAREIVKRGILGDILHVETSTNRNTVSGAWIRHITRSGKTKPGSAKTIDWDQWLGKAPKVPFSIERFYSWARYVDYETSIFGQSFSHEFDAVNSLLDLGIPNLVSSTGGQYHYKEFGDMPDIQHTTCEYREKGLSLTYSSNLKSSKSRPRTIYGSEASMTFGADLQLLADGRSNKYSQLIKDGLITPDTSMLEFFSGSGSSSVDAVSGASAKYYASRGLTSTTINGNEFDVTHLHVAEWLDCIRNGGGPSANIEKAYKEGVTIAMADIAYREKCNTRWDADNKKIIRT